MTTTPLTPDLSTHFQWVSPSSGTLTQGKIYKIEGWNFRSPYPSFWFRDDIGRKIEWLSTARGVRGISYEENLKSILEE